VALAKIAQEALRFLRIDVEVQVEQVAGAERDLGGEVNTDGRSSRITSSAEADSVTAT
jgi:hypothetical protein